MTQVVNTMSFSLLILMAQLFDKFVFKASRAQFGHKKNWKKTIVPKIISA